MVFKQCDDVEPTIVHRLLLRARRSTTQSMTNISVNEQNGSYEYLDDDESSGCTPVFFLLDFFHDYYIPSIILLGFVGNILSCIVFLLTHLKMRSSSYYLAALAMADFGFLVALLFVWLNNARVFNKEGWCQILVYVSAVCSSLSVWLIVAFTVERFIAVQYPLQRPRMCTVARAKIIVLALVVLALTSHLYSFWTAGIITTPDGFEFCDLRPDYWEIMRIISIVDSIASLIVPLILIIMMNTMITRNLLKFSIRFRDSPGASTHGASQDRSDINLNKIPSVSGSSSHKSSAGTPMGAVGKDRQAPHESCHSSKIISSHNRNQSSSAAPASSTPKNVYQISEIAPRCIHVRSSSRNLVSGRNQQSITKMLLLISTVFVLLNSPSYAIRICGFFFSLARKTTPPLMWCLQQFFMLLYYTNFSINFLLYAMCGITFRRCLVQLLRKALKSITRNFERNRRNSDSS